MMTMQDMAAAMVRQFRQVAFQIGLIQTAGAMVAASSSPSDSHQIVLDTSVESTVVMASIVEKETAVAEERPLVASVYYNRLQKRIALDADPSIIYAELLAGSYTGALHHDDMQFNSPYNTYKFVGLPPGPIANRARARWKRRCIRRSPTTIISSPTRKATTASRGR